MYDFRAPFVPTLHFQTTISFGRTIVSLVTAVVCLAGAPGWAEPLRGRVLGPDGQPVAGATVAITSATPVPTSVVTDAAGAFAADVPAGPVTIRAWTDTLSAPAHRATAGAGDVEIRLALHAVHETLTVTAAQVAMPLSGIGDSVSVLTREDLDRRQVATLGDALRLVTGFAVARNGGPGTVTSVFPRGGESDFTLVLVDGVRANAFGGGLDLSQVPIAGAARVEVVRGPQSALYGSDAIGGVIQVVSAREGPAFVAGLAEAGGRGWRSGMLSARTDLGAWRGGFTASGQGEDGFRGAAPADGSRVTNDDGAWTDVGARAGYRSGGGLDAFVSLQAFTSDRGSPGPFGSNPVGNFRGIDGVARTVTNRKTAALQVLQPLGGPSSRVRLRADLDVADFDLEFRGAFPSRGETRRTHARVQADASLPASVGASAGVDVIREAARSTFITAGPGAVPVERRAGAAFAEARWQSGDRLSLVAGVRAEHIVRGALDANPSTFSPRPAFAADTIVSVNPKFTAAWTLVPATSPKGASTRLRAAAGTGIRPPDAFEIAFTDNPGLRPERSRSSEAGLVQTAAGGAVQAEVTAFHNGYDDLIISVGRLATTSRYRTDNIANARARGLEAAVAWRPTAALGARGHYTWLDTQVLAVDGAPGQAPAPFAVGERLVRRPRHQGAVDIVWSGRRAQAFANVVFRGATLDVEPSFGAFGGTFDNPGYGMLTAGAAWAFRSRYSVQARIVNALGARYEDVLGYPALGRTVYAGFRAALGR